MNKQRKRTLTAVKRITIHLSSLVFVLLAAQFYLLNAQELMRFAVIGDYGDGSSNERDVANLVKSWNPDFIITTGDNNYPDGEAATIDRNIGQFYFQYIFPYTGSYGTSTGPNRFFPAMGNHDWDNNVGAPGQPYFNYFTLPGNERYYEFVQGPVHFFMIDSDKREPDGITSTSVQGNWLRQRLAASTSQWKIVVLHHPPYSSRTSWPKLQWPYETWGADMVLAGHAHVYERIIRNGFPYITNGIGGDSTGSFGSGITGSVCRFGTNFGAQLVTVSSSSITFQFVTRAGVVIDTYTMGPDAVTPNAPTNLTAANIVNGRSTLAWNDNAINEDGYRIERSTNGGSFTEIGSTIANASTFTATNLSTANTYSFRVNANNNAGSSNYSNTANLPDNATPPPADPTSLTATAVTSSQIDLAWVDNSQVETGYKIERCTGSTCTNFVEINQTGSNTTSYQDTGRAASTTYRYRVRAFNVGGNSGYSNIDEATTPAAGTAPGAPSSLAATAVSSTQIDLSWTDGSANEDGFKIERCTFSTCTNFVEIAQTTANDSTFQDSGLDANTTYRYRVRAFNTNGNSTYSNIDNATTSSDPPVNAPSNLAAGAVSDSQINLSWTDNTSTEEGFKIERCTGSGCTGFAEIAQVGSNTEAYNDTGLNSDTTYRYQVRAFAGTTNTGYSNIAEAATLGGPPPSGLVDDFNDGVRDTAKWDLGILSRSSTLFDPAIQVAEQNGRLSITPRSSVTGSSYSGYLSVDGWDFAGSRASVEVVQKTSSTAVTIFSAGTNKDNWYSFRAKGSTLYLESRVAGTTTSVTISYSAVQNRFWRLRHDVAADSIAFETSTDGVSWATHRTVARQFAITATKFELIAGTTDPIASPGTALFDNFVLQSN